MKRSFTFILLAVLLGVAIGAGKDPAPPARSAPRSSANFVAMNLLIDPRGKPLACYQVEVVATGDATLAGIEGGEQSAYAAAPWYDPRALMGRRIIVAAFNTGNELPTQKTRVARLMFRVAGSATPTYDVKLQVAGSTDGKRMDADVSLVQEVVRGTSGGKSATLEGAAR